MACDPEDDVDRLFACFKCGISTPESAIKERRLHPETSKKAGLVRGKASTVVEIATSSLSEQCGQDSAGKEKLGACTSVAIKLKSGKQISPIVFYGSPHGAPIKRPSRLLRLLHEIRIDLKEDNDLILREELWTTFPRQEEAISFLKAHAQFKLFSYQDHLNGQRRFLVSTYSIDVWTQSYAITMKSLKRYVLTLPVKEEVIHNLTNFFSSKAGKNSFLLPTGRFKCKDMTEQEVFMESLICRMDSDCNKLLKCQIDTDCKKTLYFDFEVQQQTSDALQHTALNAYRSDFPSTYSSGKSPFPALDAFVEFIASSGNVLVMYIADLQRAIYYQKCYDPDCRGYRSPLRPLPHDVIPSDILLFDSTQRINYREDLDTNFGLEPDGSHMEHCSCDGDELVTDSCNMENSWWQEAMTYADHIENMKNAPEFKILNEENAGDCSWWMDVEKLASLVEGQLG
ncbi:coiled-coil domain-containing protein 111 [Musa troglodytarum]|uniref:DNA-directed primase/polymerase protein n=1 Tax=Musa troglodytarum TaxID=320322 RepID=A0A9E7G225_9LILI|nr:coiled-coil domain-containing protein 111 [Musa troglodytarum]